MDSYRHLNEDSKTIEAQWQTDLRSRLLSGQIAISDVPKIKPTFAKLYVSSAFTDTVCERRYLHNHVFPKLREYCRAAHNIEFQAADLRSGAERQSKLVLPQVINSGLSEIDDCISKSAGPYYLALIGQRYCNEAVPPSILPMEIFETRLAALKATGHDVEILERYYKRDDNHIPSIYVLQPHIIYTDNWVETERKMTDLLTLSSSLVSAEPWTNPTPDLRMEVDAAILSRKRQKARDDGCIVVFREINDISERLDRKAASQFVDMTPGTNELDFEAHEALMILQKDIESCLSKNNLFRFSVKWNEPFGMNETAHRDYLTEMGNTVFEQIRRHVDVNMIEWDEYPTCPLYVEVQQHWILTREYLTNFYEQGQSLVEVRRYVESNHCQPLVVHGESGCGKSALLSKVAALVKERGGQERIILRHLGKTPNSSDVRQLVTSLTMQICEVYGFTYKPASSYLEAKTTLKSILVAGHCNFTLLIILDGVDKLSTDGHEQVDWLPLHLAPNIKLIISTSNNDPKSTFDKLQQRYLKPQSFITVSNMLPETCEWILEQLMAQAKRRVTPTQMKVIVQNLRNCPYPLYTQLLFQVVSMWTSYKIPVLLDNTMDIISMIISIIEGKHGVISTRIILCLITFSQHGISEAELQDMLSLDDQLLSQVLTPVDQRQAHIRAPNLVWVKIKQDLKPYLESWIIDGVQIINWRYTQFGESIRARYNNLDYVKSVHSIMADFYMGKWSHINNKPNTFSRPSNDYNLPSKFLPDQAASRRDVITQPLIINAHGSKQYNMRRLNELPFHLVKAGRIQELREQVIFNYEWIHTKMSCQPIERLLDDLGLTPDDLDSVLVAEAVRGVSLNAEPDNIGIELTGRLLPYYHEYTFIGRLLHQCDLRAQQFCSFAPIGQLYRSPGTFLQHSFPNPLSLSADCQFLTVNKSDAAFLLTKDKGCRYATIYNMSSHETSTFEGLVADSNIYVTPDNQYLITKRRDRIEVIQIDSQQKVASIQTGNGPISCHFLSSHYFAFSTRQRAGLYLVDIHYPSVLHKFTYQSTAVSLNSDSSLIVCNNGHNIFMYTLPLMTRCCSIKTEDTASKILFVNDSNKFCVLSSSYFVKMYTVNRQTKTHHTRVLLHDPTTLDIKLSPSRDTLLIHSRKTVTLIDTDNGSVIALLNDVSHSTSNHDIAGAGFNADGSLLFLARQQSVAVFSARSGEKMREAEVPFPSDIRTTVTFSSTNKASTVLHNSMVQIWNIEFHSSDKVLTNEFYPGSVDCFDVSTDCTKMAVCAHTYPAAKLVNTESGKTIQTFVDTFAQGSQPLQIRLSPSGSRVVTRCTNEAECGWTELRSDYVWDAQLGRVSHYFVDNLDVIFSEDDTVMVSLSCINYTEVDPSNKMFQANCYMLNESDRPEHKVIYPDGDLVGKSLVFADRNWLVSLVQPCVKTKFSGMVMQQRVDEIQLYIFDLFTSSARERRMVDCKSLTGKDKSYFIDVRNSTEWHHILLMYSTGSLPPYGANGTVNRSHPMMKGLVVYDLVNQVAVRHLPTYLNPEVSPDTLLYSRHHSRILHGLTVYAGATGAVITTLQPKFRHAEHINGQLVLDGNYMLLVASSLDKVYLINTRNAEVKGHFLIYGEAVGLRSGCDDRTVFVSTRDGRVLILMVILESCDPVKLVISKHASRVPS